MSVAAVVEHILVCEVDFLRRPRLFRHHAKQSCQFQVISSWNYHRVLCWKLLIYLLNTTYFLMNNINQSFFGKPLTMVVPKKYILYKSWAKIHTPDMFRRSSIEIAWLWSSVYEILGHFVSKLCDRSSSNPPPEFPNSSFGWVSVIPMMVSSSSLTFSCREQTD